MNYKRLFDPAPLPPPPPIAGLEGDRNSRDVYVYSEDIVLAVNVALATGRPLLLRGQSGVGKSSLARALAGSLDRDYVETVVTSRTQASDLLWTVDQLKRLQDAQAGTLEARWNKYVTPGPFWLAFDPASAAQQQATQRGEVAPPAAAGAVRETVLLVDEIDKADPDVPNNLLKPLGSLCFEVTDLDNLLITAPTPPLVIITTNEERDLPPAFLRRCVQHTIPSFSKERLVKVGLAHCPHLDAAILERAADIVHGQTSDRASPNVAGSPAEYLDLLRACETLEIDPASDLLRDIAKIALSPPASR